MIHIRDFSIKKRLLFSNFFMIIIPVIFMALLSALVFLSLQFGNLNRSTILSFLWPESGPTLSTQFELTRFRVRADQFKKKSKDLVDSAHHLEALGCRGGHRWKAGCHHLSNRRYTGHGNPFPSTFGSSQRKRFHLLGGKGPCVPLFF